MLSGFFTVFAGVLGLAFGSFLNVCATRWPCGESAAAGRSRCRACSRTLAAWENVPLASWLLLRGRCRSCKASIGWRYPLVELAVGGLWAFAAWRILAGAVHLSLPLGVLGYQLSVAAGWMVFLWLLVALAVLDAENLWLPDRLVGPGIVLGVLATTGWLTAASRLDKIDGLAPAALPATMGALSAVRMGNVLEAIGVPGGGSFRASLLLAIASPILAAAPILLIRWLYRLVRHREGIGLGDAKLMAMLAAWLGLEGALLAFCIGSVLGALIALVLLAQSRAWRGRTDWALTKLPLGSFLCLGAAVSLFWGRSWIEFYLRWAGF